MPLRSAFPLLNFMRAYPPFPRTRIEDRRLLDDGPNKALSELADRKPGNPARHTVLLCRKAEDLYLH